MFVSLRGIFTALPLFYQHAQRYACWTTHLPFVVVYLTCLLPGTTPSTPSLHFIYPKTTPPPPTPANGLFFLPLTIARLHTRFPFTTVGCGCAGRCVRSTLFAGVVGWRTEVLTSGGEFGSRSHYPTGSHYDITTRAFTMRAFTCARTRTRYTARAYTPLFGTRVSLPRSSPPLPQTDGYLPGSQTRLWLLALPPHTTAHARTRVPVLHYFAHTPHAHYCPTLNVQLRAGSHTSPHCGRAPHHTPHHPHPTTTAFCYAHIAYIYSPSTTHFGLCFCPLTLLPSPLPI